MSRYAVVSRSAKQQKRRKLTRRIVAILLLVLVLSILLALWIYWRAMRPTVLEIAQTRLKAEATLAVNEAVCAALADYPNYTDFISVEKNGDNRIVMISANSALVNSLAHNTAILSQNKISQLKGFDVNIPLGSLSGVPLLSEKGPSVNVIVSPIGNVHCTLTSTFTSAGINQTLYRIYVNVECLVDIIIPTSHLEVQMTTPILISENLIVGEVPDTFLQGGLLLGEA